MLQQFDERNRDLIVNINGELVHRDKAGISPFDSAVQGGDAVWEGLRLYRGRIFALNEHLERLRSSALALAFEQIPDDASIIAEIRRTLEANGMKDGVHIRLTLDTRREDHLRHGPAAQPRRAHADRASRAQGAGLLEAGPQAHHQQHAPLTARLSRSEDPSRQPAVIDPREDPGECGGRGRCDHAGPPRLHRRNQCDAPVHG